MPPPTTIQRTTAMKLRLSIPGSGEPLSDVGTSVASNVLAHTSRGRGGGRSGGTAAPSMGRRCGVIQVRRHREHGGRQNPRSPPKEAKTSLGAHAAPSPAQGRSCELGLCTVGAPLLLHSAIHSGEPLGAEGRGPPDPAIWKPLDQAPVEQGLSPYPCLVPERVAPYATGFQATSTSGGDRHADGHCGWARAHAGLKLALLARLLGGPLALGLSPVPSLWPSCLYWL